MPHIRTEYLASILHLITWQSFPDTRTHNHTHNLMNPIIYIGMMRWNIFANYGIPDVQH